MSEDIKQGGKPRGGRSNGRAITGLAVKKKKKKKGGQVAFSLLLKAFGKKNDVMHNKQMLRQVNDIPHASMQS